MSNLVITSQHIVSLCLFIYYIFSIFVVYSVTGPLERKHAYMDFV